MEEQFLLFNVLSMRWLIFASLLFAGVFNNVFPQEIDAGIIEDLTEEENKEFDLEAMAEELEEVLSRKIDINKADRELLLKIPQLSEVEIDALLSHRRHYGRFYTLYELKNVDGLSLQKALQIEKYLKVAEDEKIALREELKNVENQVYLRYDRALKKKDGYSDSLAGKGYKGDANYMYFKYQFACSDKIHAGLTAEVDAGERLWGDGRMFDFSSAHVEVSNLGILDNWILGDFKVNFGQGLVIGSSSIIGKSNSVLNTRFRNSGVRRYTSVGESGFFRGTGGAVSVGRFTLTSFLSCKRIDANLSKTGGVTSFKTDGLHRTESELKKKERVKESVFGANLRYKSDCFTAGISGIKYKYGAKLEPADELYTYYKLRNTDGSWNVGADYSVRLYHVSLFGEVATGGSGGIAVLNGFAVVPSSLLGVLLLHRYYASDYQNLYANGFSENSRPENESGLYIGAELKPARRFTVASYLDVYRFNWAKYQLDKPSAGYDFLSQVNYALKKVSIYAKFKYKEKEKNDTTSVSQNRHHTARFGGKFKFSETLSSQLIVDGNAHAFGGNPRTYGWTVAADLGAVMFRKRLHLDLRYAYFEAEDYNNRVYLYEKDLLYVFSIPSCYGKGHRVCVNLRWQPNPEWSFYAKFGATIYTDGRETIGSGLEKIGGNVTSMARCLVRIKI